jgi:hypothetical protein
MSMSRVIWGVAVAFLVGPAAGAQIALAPPLSAGTATAATETAAAAAAAAGLPHAEPAVVGTADIETGGTVIAESEAPIADTHVARTGPPEAEWAETKVTVDLTTHLAPGVGFSGPLGFAGGVQFLHGLGADVREEDGRVKAMCAVPVKYCAGGFLVGVAAGQGGGKLSLGIGARARVEEDDFHGTVGVGLRAAFVRTWGSPIGTEPGLSYLGPELDLAIMRVNVTLGVLWRVAGSGGKSVLFSWGLGLIL